MEAAMNRTQRRQWKRLIRQQEKLTREIRSLTRWIERDHRRFLRRSAWLRQL
jgi:hypothetical protein